MTISQQTWDEFVVTAPGGSFLQSWAWGEMQQALSVPYWRLTAERSGSVVAAALVLARSLPNQRSWLYVPRGPVAHDAEAEQQILERIEHHAQERRAVFVRTESMWVPKGSWRKADRDVQPRHTSVLDITQDEETLLAAMHHKTRYNIRLAQKRGVTVRFSDADADIDHFLRLSSDVHNRSGFSFHPASYYRAIRSVLAAHQTKPSAGQPRRMLDIAVAEYEGRVLAVHLLIGFGSTLTYVHGASSSEDRAVMAPHLLQWASITRAKTQGYHWYDFFGVAPEGAEAVGGRHPWAGITRFKEGFGGQRREYPGAYDFVVDPMWYWVYNTGRKFKGLLR